MKRALIHLAAWLCSRVKFIRCDRGGLSGGLLPVLPVTAPNALNASGAVWATDVMVNRDDAEIDEKNPRNTDAFSGISVEASVCFIISLPDVGCITLLFVMDYLNQGNSCLMPRGGYTRKRGSDRVAAITANFSSLLLGSKKKWGYSQPGVTIITYKLKKINFDIKIDQKQY
ncbi:hypothetical protein DTV15_16945 [Salmonella enterica subsp. enterica serovar Orientalis]|nr:hypothetical protein [Salmonella enterica subsp. enterica serovar Orientalis]